MVKDADLVAQLADEERAKKRFALKSFSPDDGKYRKEELEKYLTAEAEWRMCALVQRTLLETRVEMGQAHASHLEHLSNALEKLDPLNVDLLERHPEINHDQLALLEELGRHMPEETKALLHPGTTSYDILDTARSYLFKGAWKQVMRPKIAEGINKLATLGERSLDVVQAGRTHLQTTSPVLFGGTLAHYAARLAERTEKCDVAFDGLKGKISGIVGTGASIEMVIGESMEFEKRVLAKLELEPDYTATQIVQKERLADVGHQLTTLMAVLGDFANDVRLLYSSAINEVTSRDNAARLGGSSADATKNNPIQYENIAGKAAVVESGMRILYEMIHSDLQRDLRNSVQGRYQPQGMMAETYESFERLSKTLDQLSINEDKIKENLQMVIDNPSEAMVAILRGGGWVHSQYGIGHDFVKRIGRKAKHESRKLIEVALEDSEFRTFYQSLDSQKKQIMNDGIRLYVGSAKERAKINIAYARNIAVKK